MEVVVVPCLYDNYSYLIVNGNEAAVVDPSEAWPVMQAAANRGLELTAALCTHHHNDHIGGIADLIDEYQNLEVYGFYQDKKRIPLITKPVEDNDRFSVCGVDVDVIHTPGHTSTHVVYNIEDNLFVGDTMFGIRDIQFDPKDPDIVYANCKGRFGVFNRRTGQEQQRYVGFANLYGDVAERMSFSDCQSNFFNAAST